MIHLRILRPSVLIPTHPKNKCRDMTSRHFALSLIYLRPSSRSGYCLCVTPSLTVGLLPVCYALPHGRATAWLGRPVTDGRSGYCPESFVHGRPKMPPRMLPRP